MVSWYVAQADFKFQASSDPPALACNPKVLALRCEPPHPACYFAWIHTGILYYGCPVVSSGYWFQDPQRYQNLQVLKYFI